MSLFAAILYNLVVAALNVFWCIKNNTKINAFFGGFCVGIAFMLIAKACFGN